MAYQSNQYADIEKRSILAGVLAEMLKLQKYHSVHNKLPSSPEVVGIESVTRYRNSGAEKSASLDFEGRIEIFSDHIIVTFGPGFEGNNKRTVIFKLKSNGEKGVELHRILSQF